MWQGRPVLTTTLMSSCCEWTTLQQSDQIRMTKGADILEFINRVGLYTCVLYFEGFTMLQSNLENKQ